MRYLTFEDILIVAQRHVGNYQLLKENQLRYLVQMVGEKLDDKELFPTLPIKAAFYAHHIIAGHIFLDGNKRIGYRLPCPHCLQLNRNRSDGITVRFC